MFGALPASLLTSTLSQAVSGIAGQATSAAKSFESDLQSGNITGAQAFLSTLRQQLVSQGATAAGSAITDQIQQVSNDLTAGNLTAAQSDFSGLKVDLRQLGHKSATTATGQGTTQQSLGSGSMSAALQQLSSYSPLQQSAYNTALNLSLPASLPSLSVNS